MEFTKHEVTYASVSNLRNTTAWLIDDFAYRMKVNGEAHTCSEWARLFFGSEIASRSEIAKISTMVKHLSYEGVIEQTKVEVESYMKEEPITGMYNLVTNEFIPEYITATDSNGNTYQVTSQKYLNVFHDPHCIMGNHGVVKVPIRKYVNKYRYVAKKEGLG